MKTAPVSVIIPCFNCAGTIERTVDSVLTQTCAPHELIMVNDGSTDATPDYLEDIKTSHKDMVKVLHLAQNQGPSAARNLAWQSASGKYLAFLDADDTWHPQKIEIQYNWMALRPDAAITGHGSISYQPDKRCPLLPGKWQARPVRPLLLLLTNRLLTRTVMVDRTLPFAFNENKRHSEDYLLWLEAVLSGHKAFYLGLDLAGSHHRPAGATGLSDKLWQMEKGELDTYRRLFKGNLIPFYCLLALVPFSLLKHFLRLSKNRPPCARHTALPANRSDRLR
jgi:glycosyltransferase involved in cell wall biosynthesis